MSRVRTKRKKAKNERTEVKQPVNTCNVQASLPFERPADSEAVKLTKECESLTHQIGSYRNILAGLHREVEEYKNRITSALLNHQGLRTKLSDAVQVPTPIG